VRQAVAELEVRLLGQAGVIAAGNSVKFSKRATTLAMLAFVVLRRGQPVSRNSLAFTLFPDEDEEAALAELRRYLYLANKALPARDGDPWLIADAETVRWNATAGARVDAIEFERLADDEETLSDAVECYGGDLLEDVYDDWVVPERERLRSKYLDALMKLVQTHRGRREHGPAIAYARRILAIDPWREDVLRQVLAARYESGDAAGALLEFDRFEKRLRDEINARPMPETVAVRAAILRGDPLPGSLEAAAQGLSKPAATSAQLLPFVGRDAELEQLRARWTRCARGTGGLAFVFGEAGIGKTRLIGELARLVESEGGRVFAGTTTYPELAPYQCVAEALRSALPLLLARRTDNATLAALAQLLPEVRAEVADLPMLSALAPDREAVRLLDALARCVQALAAPRPLLLVLEDLHWAGRATIDAIAAIVRHCVRAPVLVVASYREEEATRGHPLRALERDLGVERLAGTVVLGRLKREDIASLLGGIANGSVVEEGRVGELYAHTEGLPIFLNETLAEDRERNVEADSARVLGGGIATTIAARTARLSEDTRTVVEIAAVAGQGFSVDVIRDVAGLSAAVVIESFAELLDRRLVREAGARSRHDYVFTHHLIGASIYEEIEPARSSRLHARIAAVMSALYAENPSEIARDLAHHYERAGLQTDAAGWYAIAAQRAAELYANEEAVAFVTLALEGLDARKARRDLFRLRESVRGRMGDRGGQQADINELEILAENAGDSAEKLDVLQRKIVLARSLGESDRERSLIANMRALAGVSDDPFVRAEAMLQDATSLVMLSQHREGLETARQALDMYEQLADGSKQIACLSLLVEIATNAGEYELSREYLERLRERASDAGDRSIAARALAVAAVAALLQQRYEECRSLSREALAISEQQGDREAEASSRARIAVASVWLGDYDESIRQFDLSLEMYTAIGHRRGLCTTLTNKTLLTMRLGKFDEAVESIERSNALLDVVQEVRMGIANDVNLSFVKLHLGEPESAKALAAGALERARTIEFPVFEAAALANLGNAKAALGEIDEAIVDMEAGIAIRRAHQERRDFVDDLSDLALAYVRAARMDDARKLGDELRTIAAESLAGALWPHYTWWVIARVSEAAGECERARAATLEAIGALDRFAASIGNQEWRKAFLAIDVNRAIAELRTGAAR
jgi:predicted ATPase/DNA-binding SARP family transcriptional activator